MLVAGLVLLGSLREPLVSPKVFVEDAAVRLARAVAPAERVDRHVRGVRAIGLLVAVVGAAAAVVVLVAAGAARPDRLPAWFAAERVTHWLPWAGCLAVVVLAGLTTGLALLAWRYVERATVRRAAPAAGGTPHGTGARVVALLVVTGVLAAAAAVLVRAVDGPWLLAQLLHRAAEWLDAPSAPVWTGVTVALLAALATVGVILGSRGLRRWRRDRGTWRRERGSGPAGVAAGWSVVYGAVALVLAGLALRWWPDRPAGARGPRDAVWSVEWVVAGLVVFAALLMVVVPWWLLARAHRRVQVLVEETLGRQVALAAARAADRSPDALSPAGQAQWLDAHGRAYSAVVRLTTTAPPHLELRPWAVHPGAGEPQPPPSSGGA